MAETGNEGAVWETTDGEWVIWRCHVGTPGWMTSVEGVSSRVAQQVSTKNVINIQLVTSTLHIYIATYSN